MKPVVAIVGRPNVGKSTLYNRLVGSSLAIVDDAPGVTRDRHHADAHVHGREIVLVDTGGFDPGSEDPMGRGIAHQVGIAIEEADVVICVLDGTAPPLEADRLAVELLRRSDKPVVYVANKIDRRETAHELSELYSLGVDDLCPVSGLHGRGTAELAAAIVARLPAEPEEEPEAAAEGPRIALIGRPNAGKSSLLNRLSGDERALVDHRPGTTRDPIDAAIEYGGKPYTIVDTAGIRRRSRVERGVEAVSSIRAIRSMGRADVAVLVCDATQGIAEQDARLLGLCLDRRRAVLMALNKVDLLSPKDKKAALEQARTALHFASWVPLFEISAKTGRGIGALMQGVATAADEFARRIPTGELNRFFEQVLARHPPPTRGGRAPRIYYITQAESRPPLFVAMASSAEHVAESYRRFVANQIRQAFGFTSVPVLVEFRARKRRSAQ
jgi:GTP-binding protein